MYFGDHNPPHIHVEFQNYTAIINIIDGTINGEMPRKELNYIYEWLDIYQTEILENWELAVNKKPTFKIEPLIK